jgi:hypothetical protein
MGRNQDPAPELFLSSSAVAALTGDLGISEKESSVEPFMYAVP